MFEELPLHALGETSADEADIATEWLFEGCPVCKGSGFVNQAGKIRHCSNGCKRRSVVMLKRKDEASEPAKTVDLRQAVTLNLTQLRGLLKSFEETYGKDLEDPHFEPSVTIRYLEDGYAGPGLYVWDSEVPSEGCFILDEEIVGKGGSQ